MSKLGRNRKGRGYGAKRTNWSPLQATHEERIQVVRKTVNGVEKIIHKPVVVPKEGVKIVDTGPNRAERRKMEKFARKLKLK